MSIVAYIILLIVVGLLRSVEIRISRRNQHRLLVQGIAKLPEPCFHWMVLFHIGILIAAGFEVALLRRPWIPMLALFMGLLFILATGMRWWVIRVMSEHWNIQVMDSTEFGVVVDGPFRWVRHPNYAAVYVELIALPLLHTAWITASAGAFIHAAILRQRLRVEDSMLLSNPTYVALMGSKPRFLPRILGAAAHSAGERLNPPV